jgi:hypothetical protein
LAPDWLEIALPDLPTSDYCSVLLKFLSLHEVGFGLSTDLDFTSDPVPLDLSSLNAFLIR